MEEELRDGELRECGEEDSDATEEVAEVVIKKGTMGLLFWGMAVVVGIICGLSWYLTHSDNEPEGANAWGAVSGSQMMESHTPEPLQKATAEPTEEPTAEPTQTPTEEPEIEMTPEPTPDMTETSGVESADFKGFVVVEESVTPKDVINLRSAPSTADMENIVCQAQNGEVLKRVGVNADTGWSQVEYGGQVLYAVSQYLTTDLSYKTPQETTDVNRVATKDGRIISFTDCDDWITPKEFVNLRTEPSTTEGNTTVSCQLLYGEKAHRTGYSADSGWSRVEYNGQILYVVTSYVFQVTEE